MIMDRYVFALSCPRKLCFDHLFAGVPGGRADVRAARHIGPSQGSNLLRLRTRYLERRRDWTRKSYISAAVPLWHIRGQTSPCRGRVLHVAPFGYTFLEVAPLSLSRGSPATRWLRRVRLDRQCATRLGKLRAERGCLV